MFNILACRHIFLYDNESDSISVFPHTFFPIVQNTFHLEAAKFFISVNQWLTRKVPWTLGPKWQCIELLWAVYLMWRNECFVYSMDVQEFEQMDIVVSGGEGGGSSLIRPLFPSCWLEPIMVLLVGGNMRQQTCAQSCPYCEWLSLWLQ